MQVRFIRTKEMSKICGGVSRTTLWRWERQGLIPPKHKIGPNTVGWLESEIEAWFATTAAAAPERSDAAAGSGEA